MQVVARQESQSLAVAELGNTLGQMAGQHLLWQCTGKRASRAGPFDRRPDALIAGDAVHLLRFQDRRYARCYGVLLCM